MPVKRSNGKRIGQRCRWAKKRYMRLIGGCGMGERPHKPASSASSVASIHWAAEMAASLSSNAKVTVWITPGFMNSTATGAAK